MYDYYMRGVFMCDVSDIAFMREKNIIGFDLKPGLLRGSVIVFWNREFTGGVWVSVEGNVVVCRHTCYCGLTEDEMRLAAMNVVHTQYQDYPVKYNKEPFYPVTECGKAPREVAANA